MIKFTICKTISHPKVEKPLYKEQHFEAQSLAAAVRMLNVSGQQACDLKNTRKSTWEDPEGRTHTLELKGLEIHLVS